MTGGASGMLNTCWRNP